MRCSKSRKYLSPYIDGELKADEIARIKSHISMCDRCSREFSELERLHSLFGQTACFSAPQGFHAKVMERLNCQSVKRFSLFPVFTRFAEAAAVIVAITAGIMTGGLLINGFIPHHRGEQVAASFPLETFEALPPDSLGKAYLAVTEEKR